MDNELYVFDLNSLTWSVVDDATGDVPPPRVGVSMAAVKDIIYVFGGRDNTHKELNELYSFDTGTKKWALLTTGETGPSHRSYHSSVSDEQRVYIFGGCGVAGRLNDLWAFDAEEQRWVQYPSPGETCKGRGGPGLAVVCGKIWVVYGFAGEEADDIHCFDPVTGKWVQVETTGEKPSGRSVFSTVGIGKKIFIVGGEVDPSDLGHLGAGKFSAESFVLDTETLVWKQVDDEVGSSYHPGARGWCAFESGQWNGETGVVVYGGNSPTNDRLDDMFFFSPIAIV